VLTHIYTSGHGTKNLYHYRCHPTLPLSVVVLILLSISLISGVVGKSKENGIAAYMLALSSKRGVLWVRIPPRCTIKSLYVADDAVHAHRRVGVAHEGC